MLYTYTCPSLIHTHAYTFFCFNKANGKISGNNVDNYN